MEKTVAVLKCRYGCEMWMLREYDKRRLQTEESKYLTIRIMVSCRLVDEINYITIQLTVSVKI
jgi:hypothetical protein